MRHPRKGVFLSQQKHDAFTSGMHRPNRRKEAIQLPAHDIHTHSTQADVSPPMYLSCATSAIPPPARATDRPSTHLVHPRQADA